MKNTHCNVMLHYLMDFGGFAVQPNTSASCSLNLINLAHCSVNLVSVVAYKFLRPTWIVTAFVFSIVFPLFSVFLPKT